MDESAIAGKKTLNFSKINDLQVLPLEVEGILLEAILGLRGVALMLQSQHDGVNGASSAVCGRYDLG